MSFSEASRPGSGARRDILDLGLGPTLSRNWGAVAARGICGLIFGLIAFLFPGAALLSMVVVFAIYLMLDGILAVIAAVRAGRYGERWGYLTFEGIVGIIAGLAALSWPGLTVIVLVGLAAAWALVSGFLELRAAYNLTSEEGRGWLVLGGMASIIFGIALVVAPMIGAVVLTWWLGAYATVFGASLLVMAFKLRKQHLAASASGQGRA
jgi:uncharacterized membrane protein HdeD (DUF308 family)